MTDAIATGPLTWEQRVANYHRVTGYPPAFSTESLKITAGWVHGMWIMGNSYVRANDYYGGYPFGYLKRVGALFPDKSKILHLFSGQVDLSALPGDSVDVNASLRPTFVDDAQTLTKVPLEQYDLVLADPPYSVEDAERYQTTKIKRNVVMRALQRLPSGAHVVWLDQVLPMYRKDAFAMEAAIGMVKSTNHRFRVISIFRRI
jgi:hypothetical protein